MKKILRNFLITLFLLILWPYFLYRKYGNNQLRISGNTIIISNHCSTFDAFFIYLIFGYRKIRFVTIKEVKNKALSRFIAWLFDCLYIDYKSTNLDFFKECIQILKDGGVICIFPEGVVNPLKNIFFDFKASFVYLARKTDALILPLYIYPALKPFKRSKIYIGELYNTYDYAEYKSLYDAATFFQCKIIEYSADCK